MIFRECGLLKKGEESVKSKNQTKISDAEEKMIVDILQQFRDTLRYHLIQGGRGYLAVYCTIPKVL